VGVNKLRRLERFNRTPSYVARCVHEIAIYSFCSYYLLGNYIQEKYVCMIREHVLVVHGTLPRLTG
jgi:hypothetical protein